jgi:poly(A) polymerase
MALSRERIADELLKLLGLEDPSATVAIMLDPAILEPVLPEIGTERLSTLESLIAAEHQAAIEPHPLRRLAALLPRDPDTAAEVGARLKLSNKARKRSPIASAPTAPSTACCSQGCPRTLAESPSGNRRGCRSAGAH